MKRLLASCFGLGRLPVAPGTWGSLPAAIIFGLMWQLHASGISISIVMAALALAGSVVCVRFAPVVIRATGKGDPGEVVADELAGLVPEGSVLGIDASSGMIEVAQKYRKDNLSFLLLDINSLDFEDEFDLVFSNATVHWVKDHNGLLRKVRRSLRNDGVVRFNFAGSGNCSHFLTIVKAAMKKPRYAKYFSEFVWPWFMPTVDEYETIVRQFPGISGSGQIMPTTIFRIRRL